MSIRRLLRLLAHLRKDEKARDGYFREDSLPRALDHLSPRPLEKLTHSGLEAQIIANRLEP